MDGAVDSSQLTSSVEISPLKRLFRVGVAVVVIASFGIWAYALSGVARRPPPDELDSTRALIEAIEDGTSYFEFDGVAAYSVRAEALCETAIDQLGDPSRVSSGPARAAQLRESNRVLAAMVESLRRLPVATDRDDTLRSAWLDDWEVLIGDRARYADRVEENPAAVFSVSRVADNEGLERRLTRFARTNLMLPCGAPADVG
ncbi:MAG: hypothetical protein HKN24_07465 [Acidimicrobiales bacterium]|nr:hypothetical protein [Acidimicrobiales bacterium]